VNLQGTYTKGASAEEHGNIQIENLSMTGLGCIAEESHSIAVGDELIVHIFLDKKGFEDIKTAVVVIHLSERFIGCRFKELSPPIEDGLASYLMLIP
jgi:c-di-GMP-binding flagellar brake protein YcgR